MMIMTERYIFLSVKDGVGPYLGLLLIDPRPDRCRPESGS